MTLSVCMIVKNEEARLERCLNSVADQLSYEELIVVDTGSTDRTVEIAEYDDFGAKVFVHPWENDFSLHRNQSLNHATGDWILIVDADEEVIDCDFDALRAWLAELPDIISIVTVPWLTYHLDPTGNGNSKSYLVMQCDHPRLFRRGRVHYEGAVHNEPVMDEGKLLQDVCPFLKIKHHYNDRKRGEWETKLDRTRDLLLKRLKGSPPWLEAYRYLAHNAGLREQHSLSMEYADKYIGCKEKLGDKFAGEIFMLGAGEATKTGEKERCAKYLNEGLTLYPEDPDLNAGLADYGADTKQIALVDAGAARFCQVYEAWKKGQHRTGFKFTYSLRPDVYALNLFRLSLIRIQEGVTAWRDLQPALAEAPEEMRDSIAVAAETKFKELGIDL